MNAAEQAAAIRGGVGLFRLADRGLLSVTGGDRSRWLDGMLSNDIAGLEPGDARSGCHALLLTRQGRIVSDPHVLLRPDALARSASELARLSELAPHVCDESCRNRPGGT